MLNRICTGFVRVLENLESPGILFWHFPDWKVLEKGYWSWKVLEICLTQTLKTSFRISLLWPQLINQIILQKI